MKITILPSDGVVGVDGLFRLVDLADVSPTIHAVQIDTAKNRGEIEFREAEDGSRAANERITDFTPFQKYVDRFTAAAPLPPTPPTQAEIDEQVRLSTIDGDIKTVTLGTVTPKTIAGLKAMSLSEFSNWFDANFSTALLIVELVKRLTLVVIRRVL